MRPFLLLGLLGLVGCSTDEFTSNANDGGVDGASVSDGAPSDAASVPISIVNKTSLLQVSQQDPVGQLSPLPSAGNAIVVAIVCFSEVANCSIPMTGGVVDNQGNTYRQVVEGASITSSTTHGTRGYLYVAENIGAPVGTFEIRIDPMGAPDANAQFFSWGALEVRGLAAADSVDRTGKSVVGNGTSTTVVSNGPTTRPVELALALHYARSQNELAYTYEAAWTDVWSNPSPANADPMSLVMRMTTATGPVSHTWQHQAPSRGAAAVMATFKGP